MNRQEIQKLLGGYATGTLTPEEQEALFAAALEDQELFDALGREQALRDLLRDPAAKAELLAALDAPAARTGGFWAWLRRPAVVGFATAGVAAIAIVAVWQGTRGKPPVAPVLVAEMKAPEVKSQDIPAAAPPVPISPVPLREKKAEPASRRDVSSGKLEARSERDVVATLNAPARPPVPQPPAVPAPMAAPPPPPPVAVASGASTDSVMVQATPLAGLAAQIAEVNTARDKAAEAKTVTDARGLFYGNAFSTPANALTPLSAGSAGAQSSAQPKSLATAIRASNVAKKEKAETSLGVRVSILRGDEEAPVVTVLNPGEVVRLKLTPNEDGFLYVAAREANAWTMVASAPVQRLKPFQTSPLPFTGSGQKQLVIMFSRQAQILSPQSIAGQARTNLVETVNGPDPATYVVAGFPSAFPQQVVQAISLTYR